MAGVKTFQFGAASGGLDAGAEKILRSSDGGINWEGVVRSRERGVAFPKKIYDLKFHPQNPGMIFLGTKGAGLWKSEDGGFSWSAVKDESGVLDPKADVYALTIPRAEPDLIYAAVFQERMGRVLKSEDGGRNFREVYAISAGGSGIADIYANPASPNHVIIITGQGGVLESRDGGRTWRVIGWLGGPLARLIVNPVFPGEMLVVSSSGKILKTFDGGKNWSELNFGRDNASLTAGEVPYPYAGVTTFNPFVAVFGGREGPEVLVPEPSLFTTLYAGTKEGLHRSFNGGFTWEKLNLLIPQGGAAVTAAAIHPRNPRIIFAGIRDEIHKSEDGGFSWSVQKLAARGVIRQIIVHPRNPDVIFLIFD